MAPKCGSCDANFKKTEAYIDCNACKKRYHGGCTKLTQAEYDVMGKKSNLKWFCIFCETDVNELLSNFEKFKKVNAEILKIKNDIDSQMEEVNKRLSSLESIKQPTNIQGTIEKEIAKISDGST